MPLWGAGLAVALGGALAGNALGSVPILDRSTLQTYYQSHDDSMGEEPDEVLPDHYPLVTPEGTVPVAALSERGLYSQARFRAFAHAYSGDPGPAPLPDYPEPAEAAAEARPVLAMAEDPPTAAEAPAPAPLRLAAGPAAVAAAGQAKLIDVALTLGGQ
ncbi:hypothetical protein [Qipengyuania sediminis]|uniref:hypothetical protein n=1 Tax=Qipengyuania sediminis TaxID=1532023 RepID=UPI00197FD6B6|nr:hypothetical protein [Qipengyuania sediminis]